MYDRYNAHEQPTADELAIQNMLNALEYSEKNNIFSDDEKKFVEKAIKTHVLWNANLVIRHLNEFDDELLDIEEKHDTLFIR